MPAVCWERLWGGGQAPEGGWRPSGTLRVREDGQGRVGNADVPLPPMPTGHGPEAPSTLSPSPAHWGAGKGVKTNRLLSGQIPETPEAWRPRFLQDPHSGRRGCSPRPCVGTPHLQLGHFSQTTSGNAHPTQPLSLSPRQVTVSTPLPWPWRSPPPTREQLWRRWPGPPGATGRGRVAVPSSKFQLSSGTEPRATCLCVRPWSVPWSAAPTGETSGRQKTPKMRGTLQAAPLGTRDRAP